MSQFKDDVNSKLSLLQETTEVVLQKVRDCGGKVQNNHLEKGIVGAQCAEPFPPIISRVVDLEQKVQYLIEQQGTIKEEFYLLLNHLKLEFVNEGKQIVKRS